jgi:hypothetical protein
MAQPLGKTRFIPLSTHALRVPLAVSPIQPLDPVYQADNRNASKPASPSGAGSPARFSSLSNQ